MKEIHGYEDVLEDLYLAGMNIGGTLRIYGQTHGNGEYSWSSMVFCLADQYMFGADYLVAAMLHAGWKGRSISRPVLGRT